MQFTMYNGKIKKKTLLGTNLSMKDILLAKFSCIKDLSSIISGPGIKKEQLLMGNDSERPL